MNQASLTKLSDDHCYKISKKIWKTVSFSSSYDLKFFSFKNKSRKKQPDANDFWKKSQESGKGRKK